MIRTVRELKDVIENIPDDYRLEISVDNGVDGKSADNGMSSNSPIRIDIWDEDKILYLRGSEYTSL